MFDYDSCLVDFSDAVDSSIGPDAENEDPENNEEDEG